MTLRNDTTSTQYSTPSTGDSVPEYWVTRVVRQMKGCSPAKIDSVIQANLPPRKIKWSQRPDTLEIPGLEGRIAYTVNLPNCYELGFFKGNEEAQRTEAEIIVFCGVHFMAELLYARPE